MKNQKGSIALLALGALVAIMVLIGAVLFISYVNANNTANALEQGIKAQFEQNRNVLAQYGQKVLEAAQVPDMARDDLVKVAKEAITSRYGEEGSKAMFQMIQEQNPTVDPALYQKIQQIVEAGRNEFATSQQVLIDKKRAYETALGNFWQGMFMRMAGFPKIKLDDYKIVSTDRADNAFKAGKEEAPLQLRQSSPPVM